MSLPGGQCWASWHVPCPLGTASTGLSIQNLFPGIHAFGIRSRDIEVTQRIDLAQDSQRKSLPAATAVMQKILEISIRLHRLFPDGCDVIEDSWKVIRRLAQGYLAVQAAHQTNRVAAQRTGGLL